MALSREAQQLLAGITGGLAGGVAGGKTGAAAGINSAMDAVNAAADRRDQMTARERERKLAEQIRVEQSRRFNIQTQLQLLDQGNLSPDGRQKLVEQIAQQTGMSPDDLKVNMAQGMRFTDLMAIVTDDDIPDAVKTEAWNENAPQFGLDTQVTSWSSISPAFNDLAPDVKQQVFEELRNGNISDINRVGHFLSNFNGEGRPITGPQLQAIGVHTGSGLTFDQRMTIEQFRQQARMTMTPDDMMGFFGQWYQTQLLLGRSTMAPEEFEAEVGTMGKALQLMEQSLQNIFGQQPTTDNGTDDTEGEGAAHVRNKARLRTRILDGAYSTPEEAISDFFESTGKELNDTEQELVRRWFKQASENDEAGVQE